MTLNDLRDKAFGYAERQGFHEKINFGERLMLIVSELSEALEADRNGKHPPPMLLCHDGIGHFTQALVEIPADKIEKDLYEGHIRGTVEEELADALIRIGDLAGILKIDLDWHVRAKMAYNETRPYMHGKKY